MGLEPQTDIRCQTLGRLWICVPQNARSIAVIKDLQQLIRNISTQMAAVGRLDVPKDLAVLDVDGRVGPTTALGAQFITAAFAAAVAPPPEVAAILAQGLSAKDTITLVAQHAEQLIVYFNSTLQNFPAALTKDPIVIIKEPPRRVPTAQAAVVGIGLLSTVGGLLSAAMRLF